jgi:MoaA/NifB/PqqE/SkfB family radical SAM enzyme
MSDYCLNISNECEMSCLGCDLSSSEVLSADFLTQQIKEGQFFSIFGKKKIINLYGGNPLLNSSFSQLVTFLHNENVFVRVWSHLNVSLDYLLKINPVVDQWCFYMPCLNSAKYQFYVGRHNFNDFDKNLTDVILEGIQPVLHMQVKPEILAELPDIVDYVLGKNVELWLHFDKRLFSRAIIKDIYYCSRYSKIYVIPVKYYAKEGSCQVPISSNSSFEFSLNYAKVVSFVKRFQTRFSLA